MRREKPPPGNIPVSRARTLTLTMCYLPHSPNSITYVAVQGGSADRCAPGTVLDPRKRRRYHSRVKITQVKKLPPLGYTRWEVPAGLDARTSHTSPQEQRPTLRSGGALPPKRTIGTGKAHDFREIQETAPQSTVTSDLVRIPACFRGVTS